jgi:diguanylate cyclase (GGDEF)-like protein
VLIVNGFATASLYLAQRDREIDAWVLHTAVVIGQLERLHQTILEAESTGRSFLVTADPEVHASYRARAADIDRELRELVHLTSGSADQQRQASELAAEIGQRFSHLDRALQVRVTSGIGPVLAMRARPGVETMQHIKRRIAHMKQVETDLLRDRKQQKLRAERDVQVLLATMAVVCLAIVAALFWRLERLWSMCSRAQADAEHLAHHDALTGLPNRRLLQDRLDLGLAHARRDGRMLAVMSLDLDGFKQVNDAHGHTAGDEVLKQVATRLQRASRDTDTVARLGGDEFVLVVGNAGTVGSTTALADRLIDALSEPYSVDDDEINIGASIGISIFAGEAISGHELLAAADAALCVAKHAGKGRYELAAEQKSAVT